MRKPCEPTWGKQKKEIPMKTSILRTLATLSLSAALGPVSLMAQGAMLATVPFDFTVGAKSFPAGDYRIREQSQILTIRSDDGRSVLMTQTRAAQPNTKQGDARLV